MSVALAAAEQRTKQQSQAPGPELFARDPRTPIELWDAVDYLIRTDQAPKAVPYLDRFQKASPDDATLVAIRDRFGLGSFMRLDDDPATRPFARPLSDALAAAARRYATRPDRVARFIADLTQTPEEQDYALRRLLEAGPYAVPPLIEALRRPGLSREDHDLLRPEHRPARALGRPAAGRRAGEPGPGHGGRRRHRAGVDRRSRGRPVPDVPGGLARRQPDRCAPPRRRRSSG